MADNSMFDTPDSPPPPAYEFSQQEFDQKISHALEESQALPPRSLDGDGEWEVWDDAAFAAAVARLGLSEGSSSSNAPAPPHVPAAPRKFMQDAIDSKAPEITQPLRIAKKARSPSPKREKERPSWYAEARLGEHAPSSSQSSAAPNNIPALPSLSSQPIYQEREPTPPPVFEAIGPSLDGPPYEGPPAVQVVLSYNPPGSRPESPLQSPLSPPARYEYHLPSPPHSPPPAPQQHYQQPQPRYQQPQQRSLPVPAPRQTPSPAIPSQPPLRNAHQSLPVPSKPAQKMGPRPVTTYNPGVRTQLPFNPQVAYTRKVQASHSEDQLPTKVDASAFYNSSVASLTSGVRRAQPPPQPRVSYNQVASASNPAPPPEQQQPVAGYQYTNHSYGGYSTAPQQQYNPYQQPAVPQYPQQQVTAAPGVVVTQTWGNPNPYMGQQYGRGW